MPLLVLLLLTGFAATPRATAAETATTPATTPDTGRPVMRQLQQGGLLAKPPSQRELVDARKALKARFRQPLSRTNTAAGAIATAELLLNASIDEEDKAVKWLMLDEVRRLGAAAGNAEAITRSIALAAALYDFDELELELRSLNEIPLQALDPQRAMTIATVAERLADRAEADGRRDLAIDAQSLAVRSWQRAGNRDAAKRAATRHDELAQ